MKLYPSVFSGKKFILIVNISKGSSSNIDSVIYKKIVELGYNPSDFILYKLFKSGQSQESLYEFFSSANYFINNGYVVENQTPWFQQNYLYKGERLNLIPDFSAFKTPIFNDLIKKVLLLQQGEF